MSKYEYALETNWQNVKWIKTISGSKDFCLGYFHAARNLAPRHAIRVIRSDGKVLEHTEQNDEVNVGMIAGFVTPQQLEYAACEAWKKAARIREYEEKNNNLSL